LYVAAGRTKLLKLAGRQTFGSETIILAVKDYLAANRTGASPLPRVQEEGLGWERVGFIVSQLLFWQQT